MRTGQMPLDGLGVAERNRSGRRIVSEVVSAMAVAKSVRPQLYVDAKPCSAPARQEVGMLGRESWVAGCGVAGVVL